KTFKSQSSLNYHKRAEHLMIKYVCDYNDCGKYHSIEPKFRCNYENCDKIFVSFSGLYQHKLSIHLSINTFKCDVDNCGKQFTTKSNLLRHRRTHSGIKPFKCDVNDFLKLFVHQSGDKQTYLSGVSLNSSKKLLYVFIYRS
ncbi:zinc finger protein 195-like, partial [Oppia nitens]|uniref:zinc finger protein 195-like n=1 Tax=Oppia nitens TaxID=1686743 RepID=UPI0023DB5512